VGAAAGTIALIAIPSLIFGFWPQIKMAFREPATTGDGPARGALRGARAGGGERPVPAGRRLNRSRTRERITHWDAERYSRGQNSFALWGTLAFGLGWLVYGCRPEGREVSEWVPICPECYERSGHLGDCPRYAPPAEHAPPPPRRCRSCGATDGEYHDPGRCTEQAALLQQAISLTEQLIQMKEDEIFVRTGRGRDDLYAVGRESRPPRE
jgi:hypothetical protein